MQSKEARMCHEAPASTQQTACSRCQRRRLCEHLAEALAVLKNQPSDVVQLQLIRARHALLKNLDAYGFNYPVSLVACQFATLDPHAARHLLFRARDLGLDWTVEASREAAAP